MAYSFLKPRRGRKSTADASGIILKKGEIFFEVNESGSGKGYGRMKMGDGTTVYKDLPYFINTSADSTITFTESTTTANATLLNEIASGAKLSTIIGSVKKLLRNLDSGKQDKKKVILGTSDPGDVGGIWYN